MAFNPAAMMKIMAAKKQFDDNHPKFSAFVQTLMRQGVNEGDIIEISIKKADGTTLESNLKVQASDMQLVEELKSLSM